MAVLDLLQATKAYCEEKTADMLLEARVAENGTENARRAPRVFIGNLPDKEAERKEAPYILLKLLKKQVDDEENTARVRIIVVTYSEDKQENYIQCINVLSRLEGAFLEDVTISEKYSCQKPIETIVYDEDFEVYQIGEMMTIWELPQIQRNVRKYLGG